eukprot:m.330500 g.330500  ORF g.330500 m.330500 type:complete len:454 (-) comp16047_c0_seq6:2368-3729(-)
MHIHVESWLFGPNCGRTCMHSYSVQTASALFWSLWSCCMDWCLCNIFRKPLPVRSVAAAPADGGSATSQVAVPALRDEDEEDGVYDGYGDMAGEEGDGEDEDIEHTEHIEHVVPFKDGLLTCISAKHKLPKTCWCLFHDGQFMWFKEKPTFTHAGWVSVVLEAADRKRVRRRWALLRDGYLYLYTSRQAGAEQVDVIDIQHCNRITLEASSEFGDTCFAIESAVGTHIMSCETSAEAETWISILIKVQGKSALALSTLHEPSMWLKYAETVLDQSEIIAIDRNSAVSKDNPLAFSIWTSNCAHHFVAHTEQDLEEWCQLLSPVRRADGVAISAIERGWLHLRSKTRLGTPTKIRRWCVLLQDAIYCFKAKDDDLPVLIIPLDAMTRFHITSWYPSTKFTVRARTNTFKFVCATEADCSRWTSAIQVQYHVHSRLFLHMFLYFALLEAFYYTAC